MGYKAFSAVSELRDKFKALNGLKPDLLKEARRLRNFIRSGEDYVFIFLALSEGEKIVSQEDFDLFKQKNETNRDSFYEMFYQVRNEYSRSDPDGWAALSPLYPGMRDFLAGFSPKKRLYIVSSKESDYIEHLLRFNHIHLPSDHVYHSDQKHNKQNILVTLANRNGVMPNRVLFLDDQVDTLIKIKPSGVLCFLAAWGYNNHEQVKTAEQNDIPVLSLNDFLNNF